MQNFALLLFGSIYCEVNSLQILTAGQKLPVTEPVFEEKYFDQFIDHYNFNSHGNQTYRQRYLITVQYWKGNSGPIFFYTGNEAAIVGFQKASGFLTDHAPKMGAMVVFAEHRYYGKSLPFGNDSFSRENIGYLTIEQALADYSYLIQYIKKKYDVPNSPVIAFGGSYGGRLATYIRIKYPNLVAGSLASSAPLYWSAGIGDRHGFFKSVTQQFGKSSQSCVDRIKQGFIQAENYAKANQYDEITKAFKTCKPVTQDTLHDLYGWVRNSFSFLAEVNYPYPSDLLAPLPGYPVDTACQMVLAGASAIEGLAAGAGLFYNGTGDASQLKSVPCFDIMEEYIECADPTGCGLGNDAKAMDYQACTEVVPPGGSTNVTDMFPALPFTLEMRRQYCQSKHGVTPRDDLVAITYWAEKLKLASNIIFSNGDLDPWRYGGVQVDLSPTLPALLVEGGAHHFDLRGANPNDPTSVIEVRRKEAEIISGWITEHWKKLKEL